MIYSSVLQRAEASLRLQQKHQLVFADVHVDSTWKSVLSLCGCSARSNSMFLHVRTFDFGHFESIRVSLAQHCHKFCYFLTCFGYFLVPFARVFWVEKLQNCFMGLSCWSQRQQAHSTHPSGDSLTSKPGKTQQAEAIKVGAAASWSSWSALRLPTCLVATLVVQRVSPRQTAPCCSTHIGLGCFLDVTSWLLPADHV